MDRVFKKTVDGWTIGETPLHQMISKAVSPLYSHLAQSERDGFEAALLALFKRILDHDDAGYRVIISEMDALEERIKALENAEVPAATPMRTTPREQALLEEEKGLEEVVSEIVLPPNERTEVTLEHEKGVGRTFLRLRVSSPDSFAFTNILNSANGQISELIHGPLQSPH